MKVEERFLNAIEEEDEKCETVESPDWREKQRRRLQQKNRVAIDQFLGNGRRTNRVCILPRYYGELLTWALHRYLERAGWKITDTFGYRGPEPVYVNVDTGGEIENLLLAGQVFVQKGNTRYIVTVDVNPRWRGSVQLEGPVQKKEEMENFITCILSIVEKENFYRGKKNRVFRADTLSGRQEQVMGQHRAGYRNQKGNQCQHSGLPQTE
jgi:hypothetical protein